MKFLRKQELVESYHYDVLGEEEVQQKLDFNVEPIPPGTIEFEGPVKTTILIYVDYSILLDQIAVSGRVSQIIGIEDVEVNSPEEFTKEDLDELIQPLLSMIQRLTYEVTEITLDRPGVQLNFQAGE